jgi:hypothetical protein
MRSILRNPICALHCALLDRHRGTHCFHGARKLGKDPVAHRLDDATRMPSDDWVHKLAAVRLKSSQRAFLVRAHQPAVATDIGRKDGGKATLDAFVVHMLPLHSEAACRKL